MFIPRIGHEVIIDFLEGDPDRPIITGTVPNPNTPPPYELPKYKNLSGFKTNSTKGGEGFNELRFDDTKGEEQVFVHAEKNMDTRVKNDAFEHIGRDRHLIVKQNQLEHVEQDRHEVVDRDVVQSIGRDHHVKIAGKQALAISSSHSLTVSADVIEVFQANQSTEVTGNLYISAMNTVIEAKAGLTLKCGSNSVVIDPSGVTITGSLVAIDGKMTRINSGPGSPAASGQAGSAVSPTSPQTAEEADEADPGQVAEVKARQKERQTGKYGATPPPAFKPKEAVAGDQDDTTWVEIELVDAENKPVPGERYG
jgi:type VI secretion system secreted protein VgrG